MRLNLDPRQRDELYQCVCHMTMQCAVKDSQSCALCSLTFCETHIPAFDAAYKVIVEASNRQRIDSAQLFAIARYLDQRNYRARAFAMALAANDLLWSTQLAQSLGIAELDEFITVIVSKVR